MTFPKSKTDSKETNIKAGNSYLLKYRKNYKSGKTTNPNMYLNIFMTGNTL